jgi:hypothetical protein
MGLANFVLLAVRPRAAVGQGAIKCPCVRANRTVQRGRTSGGVVNLSPPIRLHRWWTCRLTTPRPPTDSAGVGGVKTPAEPASLRRAIPGRQAVARASLSRFPSPRTPPARSSAPGRVQAGSSCVGICGRNPLPHQNAPDPVEIRVGLDAPLSETSSPQRSSAMSRPRVGTPHFRRQALT